MDVVQLKTLIHVAELGSLSKAAERLHIAQPALSRQIRLLEKELGVYLFDRHGRGMVITEAGNSVLEHASRIMDELDAIRSTVECGASNLKGTVAIGAPPTIAQVVTVPLARRLREEQPNLSIRFSSAYSGYLLDWLQKGEIDLAVSYDLQPRHTLKTLPVMMESLVLVGQPAANLKMEIPVKFSSLVAERLVLPSNKHSLRNIVNNCGAELGIQIDADIEADAFGALIDLVRNGFGLTILPLASIYDLLQQGILCAAPLVDPVPMRKLVLVLPADRHVSPATRYMGDCFVELAAKLVERGVWGGHML